LNNYYKNLPPPLSAGYAFFIYELQVTFTNNLLPSSLFFHSRVLCHNRSLNSNNYFISSDSMSCFEALHSNSFNSHLSPLILRNKSLIFTLSQLNYNIHFLWIHSHTVIYGNMIVGNLAKST